MPTRSNTALLAFALIAGGGFCPAAAAPRAFGFDDVDARAKTLADAAFQDAGPNLPGALQHLDHDRYASIRFKPEAARWRAGKAAVRACSSFHEGWLFDRPVKLNEISTNGVERDQSSIRRRSTIRKPASIRAAVQGVGYAGFSVHYALNLPAYKDDVLSFLGASYFRALGKGQMYGLSARGLAIDTALASGEEFPRFVEFWLEQPTAAREAAGRSMALLDSPRATGAYRFAFTPGIDSVVEVTARVYLRDKVGKLGLAPLTSMFFYGANQRAAGDDYRPEVHDSDGLSIQSKSGEWIWRPLVNPEAAAGHLVRAGQSARLRPDAARSARSPATRISRRATSASERLGRADRRVGRGPRRARADSRARRDQRQHRRLLDVRSRAGAEGADRSPLSRALAEG